MPEPPDLTDALPHAARHKTAIRRYKFSRPLSLALAHDLVSRDAGLFDYGCGHGEDVRLLCKQGISAEGWDPHFRPEVPVREADAVNLGYVLNVIEDPRERRETLERAYALAKRVLIVSVRVDQSLDSSNTYGDGVLTGWGAFQKLYTQSEFRGYLEQVLGARPYMASLGIAFVFKDPEWEARYLTSAATRRSEPAHAQVIATFRKDRIAQRLLKTTLELGRLPLPEEFKSWSRLQERFGSAARIARLTTAALSEHDIEQVRTRRRDDLLLYLAMVRLEGAEPPPFRLLPVPVQADLKALWPNYKAAVAEGDAFLYTMGKPDAVRAACAGAGAGKLVGDSFYFHRSSIGQMPNLIRLIVFAAGRVVGDVEHELVKISLDGRDISFLRYPTFDTDAHPALDYSLRVHLPRMEHRFRDYRDSLNPPILHRKDSLVDPLYHLYPEFRSLTEQEESLGLLSRNDIGFRKQWAELLGQAGVKIVGHRLVTGETGIAGQ